MKNLLLFIPILLLFACVHVEPEKSHVTVDEILSNITEVTIPDTTINVLDFGVVGDSVFNCKPFVDKAIAFIDSLGGGTLVFPSGQYLFNGPIHLVSNMELHIEDGARLFFSSNPEYYLPVVKTSWEGTFLYNYSPFIYAYQCENVKLSGKGVIDGEAAETWAKWKKDQKPDQLASRDMNHSGTPIEKRIFGAGHFLRPQLIQFYECKGVMVEDVKIEDSPFWCIHLLLCENVIVRGVKYDAFNHNNDGIDPEYCRNVLIENVTFNNSDDNVAIKAGRDDEGRASDRMSENIVIRNCHFKGLHALVIGSEMSAGVQNVFVQDCDYGGYLKRGIYLKSNPDRGGFIKNIYFKNIAFGEVLDCIYITSYYHNEGEGHATIIKDIYIDNVTCKKATDYGIVIQGFPDQKVEDIFLSNIKIDSVANALSMSDTRNIIMQDVVIGKLEGAPSFVK